MTISKIVVLVILALRCNFKMTFASPVKTEEEPNWEIPLEDLNIMQLVCVAESGSDAGMRKFFSTLLDLGLCIESKFTVKDIDTLDQITENLELLSTERVKPLCPVINSSLACLDGIAEAFSMCAREDKASKARQIANKIINNLFNLVCGNSTIVEEMVQPNFMQCAPQILKNISNCAIMNLDPNKFSMDYGCSDYELVRGCLQNKTIDCGAPGIMKVMNAVTDPFMEQIGCMKDTVTSTGLAGDENNASKDKAEV
ncbi:uncharacterized protein LOC129743440 [Uranotaenia lowii]|uniref:uncharacterized protein LOC129743440 n=1 Tax=Uranotaenia lowii TaxID=190385 RepID=UPI00247A4502|nr:uncharacterized protein LOC129743440 [Uranotaenia lowii]